MKNRISLKLSVVATLFTILFLSPALHAQLTTLMQQPLLSDGEQFTLLRIELPPMTGNADPESGHRHPGDTIVYVESGTVTNQMNDEPAKEFRAGESWYEGPNELHAQFRNNDPEETAVVIVFMVNKQDEPLTTR